MRGVSEQGLPRRCFRNTPTRNPPSPPNTPPPHTPTGRGGPTRGAERVCLERQLVVAGGPAGGARHLGVPLGGRRGALGEAPAGKHEIQPEEQADWKSLRDGEQESERFKSRQRERASPFEEDNYNTVQPVAFCERMARRCGSQSRCCTGAASGLWTAPTESTWTWWWTAAVL